jgi:hypothetical protein
MFGEAAFTGFHIPAWIVRTKRRGMGALKKRNHPHGFELSRFVRTSGLSVCPGMVSTGVRLYNRWALFVSKGSRKPLVICRNSGLSTIFKMWITLFVKSVLISKLSLYLCNKSKTNDNSRIGLIQRPCLTVRLFYYLFSCASTHSVAKQWR